MMGHPDGIAALLHRLLELGVVARTVDARQRREVLEQHGARIGGLIDVEGGGHHPLILPNGGLHLVGSLGQSLQAQRLGEGGHLIGAQQLVERLGSHLAAVDGQGELEAVEIGGAQVLHLTADGERLGRLAQQLVGREADDGGSPILRRALGHGLYVDPAETLCMIVGPAVAHGEP